MPLLFKKIKFDSFPGKIAIVTGGSSGIGLATARLLAAGGMHVWLVASNQEKLNLALAELDVSRQNTEQVFGAISANVADWEQTVAAVEQVTAEAGTPDLLVNSAGVAHPGYVQELDIDIFRWMIDVNYMGTVHFTKAVLPGMISRGSGYIVNVCSLGGYLGGLGYTAYCGSKFAVRGFTDSLRSELKPMEIGVSIVIPPDTDTPQLEYENQYKPFELKHMTGIVDLKSADEVAQGIVDGVKNGRYLVIPDGSTKLYYKLINILGGGILLFVDFLLYRALQAKAKLQ